MIENKSPAEKITADPVLSRLPATARVYEVGGAVRDALLELPIADRDYVVVGATPEAMLAAGFRPVGQDFPVFLHPQTQEEYALARAEKKSGRGYHGFTFYTDPSVTLEDDLRRRDLTINAMARAVDDADTPIDPYGGERDLREGILRHVSLAFAEDPLRVLRVARFAARFDFAVAGETLMLMRRLADSGELETLAAERLWQETTRALMTKKPSRFLQVLRTCGALEKIMPEVAALYGVPQKPEHHPEIDAGIHIEQALDFAAWRNDILPVRYALLCHDLGKGATPPQQWPSHAGHEARGAPLARALSERLKTPADCSDAAQLITQWHGEAWRSPELHEEALLTLLMAADVLRRPQRLRWLVDAMIVDIGAKYWARKNLQNEKLRNENSYNETPAEARFLESAANVLRKVDAAAIARAHADDPATIPAALHTARIEALAEFKRKRRC
ncbi:MAG: multifunctional CCA addition/repair protein [Burkholderiales bacterium]|jgi:tRNA nucleotidyltransferase (CCA-adding enzyme)|nr:multifunctional CCA addition/repair protein [Burkholderiales bacterium]